MQLRPDFIDFVRIVHFKDTFVNYSVICFEMFVQRLKRRITIFEFVLDSSQSSPVELIATEIQNLTSNEKFQKNINFLNWEMKLKMNINFNQKNTQTHN